ncbi:hypothetical protein INT48_009771 [Thamnidium elegans]|uniref:Uncharacterized protein n=1 Tax=Thamnidium elegans TaxID=101142 RepID=A0A8H7ST57_9FUNG|nr:hypothetical protein INT48_009771 [Thamnidium elegans]
MLHVDSLTYQKVLCSTNWNILSSNSQLAEVVEVMFDILVTVGGEENAINLASFEAKKERERPGLQLYQQLKNHRINFAILNRANCLVGIIELDCIYTSIVSSTGYILQLTRLEEFECGVFLILKQTCSLKYQ